jgi:hypothetical protein
MIEQRNQSAERWDHAGHARAVQNAVERVIAERRLTTLADLYE